MAAGVRVVPSHPPTTPTVVHPPPPSAHSGSRSSAAPPAVDPPSSPLSTTSFESPAHPLRHPPPCHPATVVFLPAPAAAPASTLSTLWLPPAPTPTAGGRTETILPRCAHPTTVEPRLPHLVPRRQRVCVKVSPRGRASHVGVENGGWRDRAEVLSLELYWWWEKCEDGRGREKTKMTNENMGGTRSMSKGTLSTLARLGHVVESIWTADCSLSST